MIINWTKHGLHEPIGQSTLWMNYTRTKLILNKHLIWTITKKTLTNQYINSDIQCFWFSQICKSHLSWVRQSHSSSGSSVFKKNVLVPSQFISDWFVSSVLKHFDEKFVDIIFLLSANSMTNGHSFKLYFVEWNNFA